MLGRGVPEHIRSDNGPEFVAHELRKWLGKVGTRMLYIERGSPWENGYCESFNGKLRDEFLNGEIFLLAEGGTDSDGEVARGIQHRATALGAGLQAAGTASHLAEATGAWRYGKRCAFPTSPHPPTTKSFPIEG
jgi:transposase InsO family protein